MKLLVIGLDGMDQSLAEKFDMPVLKEILSSNESLPIEEDLWTRGWTEVLSGLPGTETGAFYEMPKLDGSTKFTQSFGTSHYGSLSQPPLWKLLDDNSVRSGWFNLPTTMPAAAIDGFMVSGAGGGVSPNERIPASATHPSGIARQMINNRLIWENRFQVSGLRSADTYIPECINAIWTRATSFCELCKDENIDGLGFVVQKEPVLLTNIFMHDIVEIAGTDRGARFAVRKLLGQFFTSLDDTIAYMRDKLKPDKIAIVSDHGAAPYKRSVNLNSLMESAGLLSCSRRKASPSVKERIRGSGRWIGQKFLGSDVVFDELRVHEKSQIDFGRTRAFSNFYVPGIFVNDARFGGVVDGSDERKRVAEQVIASVNASKQLSAQGVTAVPFRELHAREKAYDLLPDVWVNLPVEMFPENAGPIIGDNPLYCHWFDLSRLPRDIGSGKKSPKAICSFPKEIVGGLSEREVTGNLCSAYYCIAKAFLSS